MGTLLRGKRNRLLAALRDSDLHRIDPYLVELSPPLGEVIYEAGEDIKFLFFPTTAAVSMLYVLESGESTEVALIGREGVVGVPLFLGHATSTTRAVILCAGGLLQMPADFAMEEFRRGAALQNLLLRFTKVLFTQVAQTAVANRHYTLRQQLCRWLLLSLDRCDGNELKMTQQLIAEMLGVRREGVTEAARELQDLGMIRYRRGHITVVDRPAMERCAGECYSVVRADYASLPGT